MIKKGIFDKVYDEIISNLIEQGLSDEEIINFMIKQSLPREIACMLLCEGWLKKLQCKKKVITPIVIENMVCYPPTSNPPLLQDAKRYGLFQW